MSARNGFTQRELDAMVRRRREEGCVSANKEMAMTVSQDLAEVLAQEAKSQRISRRELGERAGNKNALYKMADASTISVETFWKMCDVLHISAHDAALRVNMRRQQRREMEAMEAKAERKP
jgi:hypothetical protein